MNKNGSINIQTKIMRKLSHDDIFEYNNFLSTYFYIYNILYVFYMQFNFINVIVVDHRVSAEPQFGLESGLVF